MKVRILLLSLLCLGAILPATAQNQVDKQGRKQGLWIRTDKDGSKIYQGTFRDNLEVDTFTYFYPNGQVRMRNIYSVPGKVCAHQAYDEQGHLLATGSYNQKNRDGEWRIYNEQGNLVKIAHYRMGVREGLQVIFTSNGDTAEVSTFADNHRHGRWWKRVGKQGSITATYVHGRIEGRLVELDEQGRLAREGEYMDGDKHGAYRYYEEGRLTINEHWQRGVLTSREILLSCPDARFVPVDAIAYFYPKGSSHAIAFLKDGTKLNVNEDVELISYRMRQSDNFVLIDKKNRISVNTTCILGLVKDGDGREHLSMEPAPSFAIFPDEDGLKLIKSLSRENEMDQ